MGRVMQSMSEDNGRGSNDPVAGQMERSTSLTTTLTASNDNSSNSIHTDPHGDGGPSSRSSRSCRHTVNSSDVEESPHSQNGAESRRRNRRRRRRARRSAVTTENGRASVDSHQSRQSGLQQASMSGNYNMPAVSQLGTLGTSSAGVDGGSCSVIVDELDGPEEEATKCQIRTWPHKFSFIFACLSCTIGMFSISRFALLTIDFGPIFIAQFLLLTVTFGVPLFLFFVSTGQYLGSGVIDMWRISPIFQGIGVAVMLAQGFFGIYNISAISWLFVYFRDSFITSVDRYKWSYCLAIPAYGRHCRVNGSSWKIEDTIPDYFSGTVLLRSSPAYPHSFTGELRFQTLFNIVVIWMAVFIGLSKGVRSYGKVVYLFSIFSIVGFLVFAIKTIDVLPTRAFRLWFAQTNWMEFVYNGESWICAARECFFIWGLLGATLLQMASHNNFRHPLARDALVVVLITSLVLVLSGLLGFSLVSIIRTSGYEYTGSSFESFSTYGFLKRRTDSFPRIMRGGKEMSIDELQNHGPLYQKSSLGVPAFYSIHPPSQVKRQHISFLAGIRLIEPGKGPPKYSGYQVMRLATELVPTYSAILGPRLLSPFWLILFYFTMILLGLGQQMALVHTVSSGLIAIRADHFLQFESSLTFMSCLLGLVFSFPMATEFGEFIVYFLDYTIGCGWWLMVLYVIMMFAILVVRGKPYSGEDIARALVGRSCPVAVSKITRKSFTVMWTMVLPIGLVLLCIISFRFGRFAEMFDWTSNYGYLYLPSWVREIGAMMQILPILIVPFVAVIQSCRYFLNSGTHERFHERINNLYRPDFNNSRERREGGRGRNGVILTNYSRRGRNGGSGGNERLDDPPPKYTPPPSYSTATGARIARFLRQSFRQSVRRLRGGEPSQSDEQFGDATAGFGDQFPPPARCKVSPPGISNSSFVGNDEYPPPDYATVIIETSLAGQTTSYQRDSFTYNETATTTAPTVSGVWTTGLLMEETALGTSNRPVVVTRDSYPQIEVNPSSAVVLPQTSFESQRPDGSDALSNRSSSSECHDPLQKGDLTDQSQTLGNEAAALEGATGDRNEKSEMEADSVTDEVTTGPIIGNKDHCPTASDQPIIKIGMRRCSAEQLSDDLGGVLQGIVSEFGVEAAGDSIKPHCGSSLDAGDGGTLLEGSLQKLETNCNSAIMLKGPDDRGVHDISSGGIVGTATGLNRSLSIINTTGQDGAARERARSTVVELDIDLSASVI